MKRIDMTGWVMNQHGIPDSHWTVIKYLNNSKWECQCDCSNQTIRAVNGSDLRSGHSKSCGCYKAEQTAKRMAKDITNQKYGKLTALYPTEQRQQTNIVWHCKCDCGNEIDVSLLYLQNGHTSSCGCQRQSKGISKIKEILITNNIPFEEEKTFVDCKDKNMLPFDLFVDNKYLIEYDGEQHFKPGANGSAWHNLEYYQKHDKIKNEWALANNIQLIRIPYYVKNIILEDLLPETSKYLL